MAEINHRYTGRTPSAEEEARQTKREKLDARWKEARIKAEHARQKMHEVKLVVMKGELIPKELVQRQAAFLVLSLRARLMQVAEQHARELLGITEERELQLRLDSILRDALDEIADMSEKVTDEHWLQTLADERTPSVKKPPAKAKRKRRPFVQQR